MKPLPKQILCVHNLWLTVLVKQSKKSSLAIFTAVLINDILCVLKTFRMYSPLLLYLWVHTVLPSLSSFFLCIYPFKREKRTDTYTCMVKRHKCACVFSQYKIVNKSIWKLMYQHGIYKLNIKSLFEVWYLGQKNNFLVLLK